MGHIHVLYPGQSTLHKILHPSIVQVLSPVQVRVTKYSQLFLIVDSLKVSYKCLYRVIFGRPCEVHAAQPFLPGDKILGLFTLM